MAVFDGLELKRWMDEQGMTVAELASRVGCDESTIFKYRSGKLHPNPDVAYQICNELGDVRRWQDWMRTEYPTSYGRVHPEPIKHGLQGTIMALYSEIRDLEDLERAAIKDGADGVLDCMELHVDMLNEVNDLLRAAQSAKALLEESLNGKTAERERHL